MRPQRPLRGFAKRVLRRTVYASMAVASDWDETPRDHYRSLCALSARNRDAGRSAPDGNLTASELRVSSQNGEDGVIAEALTRLQIGSGYFVEFGAAEGREGNCVFLADVLGWSGLFIEGSEALYARLDNKYRHASRVQTVNGMVTPENVEDILVAAGTPADFDVLSIDVDGQDWWIWRSIRRFRPKLVVVEYNAGLPRGALVVEPEGGHNDRGFTAGFGASIGALRVLGESKGYRLVHTDLAGVNAFFIRSDLDGPWPNDEDIPIRGPNYRLRSLAHPTVPGAEFVEVGPYLDTDG